MVWRELVAGFPSAPHSLTMIDLNDLRARFDAYQDVAEEVMQVLALPYRVVDVSTGDKGRGQVFKNDIETWMPVASPTARLTAARDSTTSRRAASTSSTTQAPAGGSSSIRSTIRASSHRAC